MSGFARRGPGRRAPSGMAFEWTLAEVLHVALTF